MTITVLLGSTSGPPTFGDVPNSALDFSSVTLNAGTGISISGSPLSLGGTATISATGSGVSWSSITGSQALLVNNGYFVTSGALALTLPTTSAVGDVIEVILRGGTSWSIGYTTGQQIFFGNTSCTVTSGTLASSAAGDWARLICSEANLTWVVAGSQGNLTVA